MNPTIKQKTQIKKFIETWTGHGYEKGESQSFWIDLLRNVLGVDDVTGFIEFEGQVQLSHTSFIDAYIPSTKVLIEQKSIDKDLRKAIPQSDGTLLTPFQQAKRYASELPVSKHPRWVVVCNFKSFLVYDMEQPQGEPFEVQLCDLEREYKRLLFLVSGTSAHLKREMEVSFKAGELVGRLYEALLQEYLHPDDPKTLRSLNILCVRLVFCLYSEDAGLFGTTHSEFYDYLNTFKPQQMRRALIDLFEVLDTPLDQRDPYLEPALAVFPYVAGGLFQERDIEIPNLTQQVADLLLTKASDDFDWSQISPTIFGAVFESTLNPETRRSGGMHYTSIENIHKVIDPLFYNDLRDELDEICAMRASKLRRRRLYEYQQKLASLRFLDPACGSGNFLTETYLSLRRLENRVILLINDGDADINYFEPIKVNISQFYGIEINDFAVTVATTALWIAEAQMWQETEKIVQITGEFLPLRNYSNIHEGNALRMDWKEVIDPAQLNYIMGNPPFVGARLMSEEQKDDVLCIFGKDWKNVGNLDYVCCWYKKAVDMMLAAGTNPLRAALVSTNSVSQGEQVANLWKPLMEQGVHIDFAWRTFRWDSEATLKAHVHCVIIGFSVAENKAPKQLYYSKEDVKTVKRINAYLIDVDAAVFVESRKHPIAKVPEIGIGNKPIDGGNYLFTKEEMEEFIKSEPASAPYFKQWYGSEEFIHRTPRYCLWLGECSPAQLRNMPNCLKRVEKVRALRMSRESAPTRKLADKPTRFHVENMPKGNSVLVPKVSSERRKYIPMGLLEPTSLCSDLVFLIPDATLYHFGVLESNIHMAWMRAVCGRLKSDYRYSKDILYNNFPWPTPTEAQRAKIEQTAQAILDARALYPDSSLADLYDEVTMPPELRKAHQQNDRAVMEAYGFPIGKDFSESDCVARLFEMYQKLTK